jgi:hypothetical protein
MSFTANLRPAKGPISSVEAEMELVILERTMIAGIRVPGIETFMVSWAPASEVLGIEPGKEASNEPRAVRTLV